MRLITNANPADVAKLRRRLGFAIHVLIGVLDAIDDSDAREIDELEFVEKDDSENERDDGAGRPKLVSPSNAALWKRQARRRA